MSDKRSPRAMGQLTADRPDESGPTIVGGQPPKRAKRATPGIPVGLERVLYLAASDPAFRAEFAADRLGAAQRRGFGLHPSEAAMLEVIPQRQLDATIDGMDLSRANLERRGFLRQVAACAVTIAAGEAALGCSDGDGDKVDIGVSDRGPNIDAGVRTDRAWPRQERGPNIDAGGRADRAWPRQDGEPEPDGSGFLPDRRLCGPDMGVRPDTAPPDMPWVPRDRGFNPDMGSRPDMAQPDMPQPPRDRGFLPDAGVRPDPDNGPKDR